MGFIKCNNREAEIFISTAVGVNAIVILAETSKFLIKTTLHLVFGNQQMFVFPFP